MKAKDTSFLNLLGPGFTAVCDYGLPGTVQLDRDAEQPVAQRLGGRQPVHPVAARAVGRGKGACRPNLPAHARADVT